MSRIKGVIINYKILLSRERYRYIVMDKPLENERPDYRLQKWWKWIGWKDEYLFDNEMQMTTAMEDFEYTKWLCNDPAYVKDNVKNPYPK